jgi:hypothetical protein
VDAAELLRTTTLPRLDLLALVREGVERPSAVRPGAGSLIDNVAPLSTVTEPAISVIIILGMITARCGYRLSQSQTELTIPREDDVPTSLNPALLGFVTAVISVLVFHQGMWELLHLLGLMPPWYPTDGALPFGVPRIINLCF